MKYKSWIVVLLLMALLLPARVVFADDGGDGGKVIFGGNFVLRRGEELEGGLAVFGGNATLQVDSTVDGDVLVMGGSLTVAGEIDGDVAVLGGDVRLEETAVVEGDLLSLGGNVNRAEGAVVRGKTLETLELPFRGFRLPGLWYWRFIVPAQPEWPERPVRPQWPMVWGVYWIQRLPDLLGRLFLWEVKVVGTALLLALLALLVVSLWPRQTELVASTVLENPGASLGVGLLTLVVVAGVDLLFLITICLSPLALLLALATAVAWIFGWIAVGWLVGRQLLQALKVKELSPLWESVIGVFVISLLGAVPCIGWLIWLVGGAFGLGAVVLTRFGTQRYEGERAAPMEPVPSPEAVEEEAVLEEELKPAPPGDDLERIRGIGPVFAARLRQAGITTFAQLAAADPEELAAIVNLPAERVVEDDWIGQARKLRGQDL